MLDLVAIGLEGLGLGRVAVLAGHRHEALEHAPKPLALELGEALWGAVVEAVPELAPVAGDDRAGVAAMHGLDCATPAGLGVDHPVVKVVEGGKHGPMSSTV